MISTKNSQRWVFHPHRQLGSDIVGPGQGRHFAEDGQERFRPRISGDHTRDTDERPGWFYESADSDACYPGVICCGLWPEALIMESWAGVGES